MQKGYADALGQLVDQLARLPGIGRKSAQRLAFYVLGLPRDQAADAAALADLLCAGLPGQFPAPAARFPTRSAS